MRMDKGRKTVIRCSRANDGNAKTARPRRGAAAGFARAPQATAQLLFAILSTI